MYKQSITRKNRTLFVVVIDQSVSMAGSVVIGAEIIEKSAMVARVANDLIAELVERTRRLDGLRDYYDVAIVGYSGLGVRSLLGEDTFLPITELDQRCVQEAKISREYRFSDGQTMICDQCERRWVEPLATGSTPMFEALLYVRDIVEQWCLREENRDSFPPVIYNITDGESTDCNYQDICDISSQIKNIGTRDGGALLFNIHIASTSSSRSLLFPSVEQMSAWEGASRSARSLFDASSHLPAHFCDYVCNIKSVDVQQKFKAVSFNCSPSELITVLNIGSRSVKCK